ncbi:SET and MYND domain-containing protein 4 [Cololabis saira]|uniref:SET and MYND domain-containing protein 4 n=1 Tax=Cololabis saira TaxID=129043 RepID=UPI002AD400D0|nr:SET and MYND domain-containing protein 4 [Cololabis saira]
MMALPCLPWQEHVTQKWTELDPQLKETFSSLLEIDDVFNCALSLTTQNDLDVLQSVSEEYSGKKDTDEAAKSRDGGNSSFKARHYVTAVLHYSQGVCLAPKKSEQLCLCYANRSAALYHLQRYKECLDDIDRAFKNDYPPHLSHKLQERRRLCLNRLSLQEKTGNGDHNHASDCKGRALPDKAFPLGPQVSVDFSAKRGRGLVALERIAAGEEILVDRPYSCVLIPGLEEVRGTGDRAQDKRRERFFGTEHRRCHWCLAETLCCVPCEACSYSRYCSSGCQQEAWEEHHRWECPMGPDLRATGVLSQLALRVAVKAGLRNIQMARQSARDQHEESDPSSRNSSSSDQISPDGSYHGDSYMSVFHLLHHTNRHNTGLRFLCAVTMATLYLKLSETGPLCFSGGLSDPSSAERTSEEGDGAGSSSESWVLGSAALRHMLQLRCNAQAVIAVQDTGAENSPVQSRQEIRIATAMFPTLSLLNHSCRPNTSMAFSTGASAQAGVSDGPADTSLPGGRNQAPGVTVTVRAAKVITSGQEILHCYGPHSSRMETPERQRILQEQYYFLCECEACGLQEEVEEVQEVQEGRRPRSGPRGSPYESGLLCGNCKGALKKSSENGGGGFTCALSTCGGRMSSAEVSSRLQEVRVVLDAAVELMEKEMPGEALQLLKRTGSGSGRILAETHPLQGELADATARAYATMGDWKNAASHLERSAAAAASQFGEDSVEVGQQLFKVAQLHFNGGARGPALSVIPKVRRILCLHCGPHCPEVQELKAMENCLRGSS